MKILGISAFYHDAAAAIIEDGKVVAAAQEERFSRIRHDAAFPAQAVRYCLDAAHCRLQDLDAIAFHDKPFLKFERLLETYYAFAPRGLKSFLTAMPVWLKEKIFLKRLLHQQLSQIGPYPKKQLKLLFPEHHLSHAASAFYPSGLKEAAILTLDGVGEWATTTIGYGIGRSISALQELRFPHSLGLLYSAFTYYLGFRVNSGEYKMMGLAPYGDLGAPDTQRYLAAIRSELVDIRPDGSFWLNQDYFNYATGLTMVVEEKWQQLFGLPRRQPESAITARHCHLALAIQTITEEIVLNLARQAKQLTDAPHLCLAGGVALNSVANGKLRQSGLFQQIFIQPAAGDAGGALGAALAAYHLHFGQERQVPASGQDGMQGAYLGPAFTDADIEYLTRPFGAVFENIPDPATLAQKTAALLADGQAIGWFQGRMEFGPRALGNRSILADARHPDMQQNLNLKVKFRESFRPFAPAVLAEDAAHYFELPSPSPYMLLVQPVSACWRLPLPAHYAGQSLQEKLYCRRSAFPAITHVDFSARIQTVHADTNPRFHQLLQAFKALTGTGMLVNTSFNVRGEPIVCTPADAYRCFMRTGLDYLVMGNCIFDKTKQPPWPEKANWQQPYGLD
jgi:carbamoyltransferase